MEVGRRDSLNPNFVQRLTRVQKARVCRFCLGNSNRLISIQDSDRIQLLISECYHGCLGTLNGNASRFVCADCYQRLEQSYEFLLLATRVQALVDTYTFHDGEWPLQSLLDHSTGQTGEKRVASSDEDSEELEVHTSKRVRVGGSSDEEEEQQGESSSLVGNHCDTPGNLEDFNEPGPEKSVFSLESTLSGEITGSDLFQECESPYSGSVGLKSPQDSEMGESESGEDGETDYVDSIIGELSKDLSMVQNLCLQIQAFGVGRGADRSGDNESVLQLGGSSNNNRSNRREDG